MIDQKTLANARRREHLKHSREARLEALSRFPLTVSHVALELRQMLLLRQQMGGVVNVAALDEIIGIAERTILEVYEAQFGRPLFPPDSVKRSDESQQEVRRLREERERLLAIIAHLMPGQNSVFVSDRVKLDSATVKVYRDNDRRGTVVEVRESEGEP